MVVPSRPNRFYLDRIPRDFEGGGGIQAAVRSGQGLLGGSHW